MEMSANPPVNSTKTDNPSHLREYAHSVRRHLVLNSIVGSPLIPEQIRWRVLRRLGMQVEKCVILSGTRFSGTGMEIGAGTFINHGCLFDTSATITLGHKVYIGMQATFVTTSHEVGEPGKRAGAQTRHPIAVGDGVWIGAKATVLPGVTIGAG